VTTGIYPFRPPRVDPPVGPRTGDQPTTTRYPRVDPPVGPRADPGTATRYSRVDPPVGPIPTGIAPPGAVAPDVAAPPAALGAPAAASDPRSQAIAQLLARAEKYGDRGDSTQTINDILNAIDMGGAGRATASWQTANGGLQAIGDTYTAGLAAALKAQRAMMGRRGGGGGGGGGGGSLPLLGPLSPSMPSWLDDFLDDLDGPRNAPTWQRTPADGRGYGYGPPKPPEPHDGRRYGYASKPAPKPAPKPSTYRKVAS
jgi:hypothetical protein